MASYPGAIKNFLILEDGVDKVLAAHPNDRAAEITAIETELGINPAGSLSDVKTRLAVALNDDGTIKTGAVGATQMAAGAAWRHSGTQVVNGNCPGSSFTDLDLSAVVGANYACVLIKVKNNDGIGHSYKFRMNGDGDDIGYSGAAGFGGSNSACVTNGRASYIWVNTDSAGIVEWAEENDQAHDVDVWVMGYIK